MNRDRILIVDDEANIRFVLKTALETEDYDVIDAADGREALDRIRAAKTPAEVYSLVLLDLNMPGLDGMAVLEQIATLSPELRPKVVVLTAFGSIPAAVKATRLGAADFLEKPITPDVLREVVRDVLDEPRAPRAAARVKPQASFEQVLERVRKSLRSERLDDAQTLLTRAADCQERQVAEQFNLLGVLYESQHRWRLAKKFYGKAIAADGDYSPAQTNMQRIYELYTFGRSAKPVLLGDEPAAERASTQSLAARFR